MSFFDALADSGIVTGAGPKTVSLTVANNSNRLVAVLIHLLANGVALDGYKLGTFTGTYPDSGDFINGFPGSYASTGAFNDGVYGDTGTCETQNGHLSGGIFGLAVLAGVIDLAGTVNVRRVEFVVASGETVGPNGGDNWRLFSSTTGADGSWTQRANGQCADGLTHLLNLTGLNFNAAYLKLEVYSQSDDGSSNPFAQIYDFRAFDASDHEFRKPSISGVTYAGNALTLIASGENDQANRTELWAGLAPTVGTANVSVAYSGSLTMRIGAFSFYNLTQSLAPATSVTVYNIAATSTTWAANITPTSAPAVVLSGLTMPTPGQVINGPGGGATRAYGSSASGLSGTADYLERTNTTLYAASYNDASQAEPAVLVVAAFNEALGMVFKRPGQAPLDMVPIINSYCK